MNPMLCAVSGEAVRCSAWLGVACIGMGAFMIGYLWALGLSLWRLLRSLPREESDEPKHRPRKNRRNNRGVGLK